MKHSLLIFFLISFIIKRNEAIKCYSCQTITDSRCNDPLINPSSNLIVDCDFIEKPKHINQIATICRKIKQNIYGQVRITRSCGYIESASNRSCSNSYFTESTSSEYCECHDDLFLIISTANAIKCFQCNSIFNNDCLTLNSTRIHKIIVDCDDVHHRKNISATFCKSIYQKSNSGHERVTRSCGFLPQIPQAQSKLTQRINRCTKVSFFDSTYSTYCECSTELCNDTTSIVAKWKITMTSLFILLIAHTMRHFL
ncbi:hypothetical protein PVAND_012488 [Polypedilum vanderplanki]|uniref:Protein sleepless n=1 Tax=Polypedilum vanderplanki TaxID=319348 RepID=A0A9J6CMM3_POLVA|nr:hypothetical protein PVAND_012488 [Polypedilum vanderplanki]